MRAFYQGCHDYTTAATAISGTSGFVAVLSNAPKLAAWLTAVVALASTLDLVFGFDKKAVVHDALCRRFTELAAKIEAMSATEDNLIKAKEQRLAIEVTIPRQSRGLL